MDVSPNTLRKETVSLVQAVTKEMKKYEDVAERLNTSPFSVVISRDNGTTYPNEYATLVSAKINGLNTLTLLNEKRR